MNQDILEAIAKSLPAMQMDSLRKELEKAKLYEQVAKEKQDELKISSDLRLQLIIKDSQIIDLKKQVLTKEDLEKRERDLQLELLKGKAQCAEQKYEAVKDLAYAAFRNPTVVKSFNRHVGVPSGGYTNVVSESESTAVE